MKVSVVNKIEEIFGECLLKNEDNINTVVEAYGYLQPVRFNSEKLKNNREIIEELLTFIPSRFKESNGGGLFLYKCGSGLEWYNYHSVIEKIIQLGFGIDRVSIAFSDSNNAFCDVPEYSVVGL